MTLVVFLMVPAQHLQAKETTGQVYEVKATVMDADIFGNFPQAEENLGEDYDEYILEVSEEFELNPYLLCAVMEAESSFLPDAKAYDGSFHYGLMQLSEKYFWGRMEELGAKDMFDAKINIYVGAEYLASLLDKYDGVTYKALMEYNQGTKSAKADFRKGKISSYAKEIIDRANKCTGT
jgi:soluble lytic murein transglycosylase-like protein